MMHIPLSDSVLRRIPKYYHLLCEFYENGREVTSAVELGDILRVHYTQIRKDLGAVGCSGRPKIGYRVEHLLKAIQRFFDWDNPMDACIVGVGNLGQDIINYGSIEQLGIKVVAAFDINMNGVVKTFRNIDILPLFDLGKTIEEKNISIGIIVVPDEHAQNVATLLVRAGIQAIWNFGSPRLEVPPHVIVENVGLSSSLAILSKKMLDRRRGL